jgi:hypothetical protein
MGAILISFYIMVWVDFLPILFFILKPKIINSNLLVFSFLASSFLSQLISYLLFSFGQTTLPVIIYYYIVSTFIIIAFYFKNFQLNKISIFIISIIYFLVTGFFLFKNYHLSSFGIISNAVCISLSIYALIISIIRNGKSLNAINFGFTYSVLFYNSGAIILFGILPYLISQTQSVWVIHNVIEMISKLIITYSLWKTRLN